MLSFEKLIGFIDFLGRKYHFLVRSLIKKRNFLKDFFVNFNYKQSKRNTKKLSLSKSCYYNKKTFNQIKKM